MKRVILDKTEFMRLWDECAREDTGKITSRFSNDGLTMLVIDVDGSISVRKNTAFADGKLTYFFPIKMNAEISFSNAQKELDKYHGTLILAYIAKYKQMLAELEQLPPLPPQPELPSGDISLEVLFQWQADADKWDELERARDKALSAPEKFAEEYILRSLGGAPKNTHVVYEGLHFFRGEHGWEMFTDQEWKSRVEF